ncbi:CHASE2 domain-containing protein [Paraburkholderia sp. BR10937]|uniref:CHASE2 domain-containing protein n=1 Tax=Paraburkholderia sp. BR10937 TaxID=3236994 RepID=UPI0034D2F9F3
MAEKDENKQQPRAAQSDKGNPEARAVPPAGPVPKEGAEDQPTQRKTPPEIPPEKPPGSRPRWHSELLYIVVVTLILLVVKELIVGTSFGDWCEVQAFTKLENILPDTTRLRLPVVVLDIRDVKGGYAADQPSSRDDLRSLIQALHQAGAAAVGVDIDVSPNQNGWLDRAKDPNFFDFCLETTNQGMPVFLGVYRTRDLPSERWLGLARFKPLATFLGAAPAPDGETVKRVLAEYKGKLANEPLPTLSYALAKQYVGDKGLPGPPEWLERFLEPLDESTEGRLVNYSKLGQLGRERSTGDAASSIAASIPDFNGKIVLLGDVEEEGRVRGDAFRPPGGDLSAGVLYHASSTYTFAIEPLYEFRGWVEVVLDFVLALCIFLGILAIGKAAGKGVAEGESESRITEWVALILAFVVLMAIGIGSLLFFRVMWLDAVLAGLALLLHNTLVPMVKKAFHWVRPHHKGGAP